MALAKKADITPPVSRANEVDRLVGARIKQRRVMLGLSQQHVAETMGITYQQFHKYERGINRISAGRLYDIARALGVPAGYFFEGLDEQQASEETKGQRRALELARNFAIIRNERHKEVLGQLARVLASDDR